MTLVNTIFYKQNTTEFNLNRNSQKKCDKNIESKMLTYAIIETFKSGFLFDNSIKILKKKIFPHAYSKQKKQILLQAFLKECELFSFFKTFFLSFPDYYLVDRCVNFRGDFIFATSLCYQKNKTLAKRATNNCTNAYYLLHNCDNAYVYQNNVVKRHDLQEYEFDVSICHKTDSHKKIQFIFSYDNDHIKERLYHHNCSMNYSCDYSKICHYYYRDIDGTHKKNFYCHYFYQNANDREYHHGNYYDYTREHPGHSYAYILINRKKNKCERLLNKMDEQNSRLRTTIKLNEINQQLLDEIYFSSKNNKEVNSQKWTSNKKIITKYIPNKNSKKSRKIMSKYKN